MKLKRDRDTGVEVNLTPLIDVVFLLLIFFMVSTTFQREAAIRVELPQASGEESNQKSELLTITIDAEGRYFLGNQQVVNTRIETLKAALIELAGPDRESPVIINADAKTPHQAVITAMDAAGQLGFVHLTFATRKPERD